MPSHTQPPNEVLIALYLDALRAQKRAVGTIEHYGWLLHALAEHLHPAPLLRAEHTDLLRWQTSISRLTPGAVANYVAGVRTFYRWCVRPMHYLDLSPAQDLVVPHVPRRRPRPIPAADVARAFIGATADDTMYAWLLCMRFAGLRCCEVAWFMRDWIVEDDEPYLLVTGKGSRQRVVPIDPILLTELRPWMQRQGHLFTHPDGRPFTPRYISHHMSDFFEALGLPYTAHQLRHTYGTRSLEVCGDLRVVQELMGHATPETTAGYTQPSGIKTRAVAHHHGDDLRELRKRRR